MGNKDPRIDAYIAKSPAFARPIMTYIRGVVHGACPEVEETMKWSSPHFDYQGMMCGMAAFKEHCAFGFWKGSLIVGKNGEKADAAMGQFGRITKLSDLPSKKTLAGYVKKAMALNEAGVKAPAMANRKPRQALAMPSDLETRLAKNKRARAAFEAFPPSHRREYIEWITEAKRPETRKKRIDTAIQWMSEGKPRNWKYM